jgi:hypothetical protein
MSDIEILIDAIVVAGVAGVFLANIRSQRRWRDRMRPRH